MCYSNFSPPSLLPTYFLLGKKSTFFVYREKTSKPSRWDQVIEPNVHPQKVFWEKKIKKWLPNSENCENIQNFTPSNPIFRPFRHLAKTICYSYYPVTQAKYSLFCILLYISRHLHLISFACFRAKRSQTVTHW